MPLHLAQPHFNYSFDVKSQTSTEGQQSNDFQQFYQDQLKQIESDSQRYDKSKLKSSLCRNFTEKGMCPYGQKCQFAHGPSELKINNHTNTSYKTKPCHAFLKKGYCQFGYRCNFVHRKVNENQSSFGKLVLQNFPQLIPSLRPKKSSNLIRILKSK